MYTFSTIIIMIRIPVTMIVIIYLLKLLLCIIVRSTT
jgi:hypothetical protein